MTRTVDCSMWAIAPIYFYTDKPYWIEPVDIEVSTIGDRARTYTRSYRFRDEWKFKMGIKRNGPVMDAAA